MATLTAIVLGIVLGVGLGWLTLSGLLALAFKRARILIRRMAQRRTVVRSGAAERRADERRTP